MQRATQEFAEDLDKVRGADDFRNDSLGILVGALRQGTEGFSAEERRRVVMAGAAGKTEK
jgi:ribosome assembly protein 3